MRNSNKRKMFWIFVALAYAITWVLWIPVEQFATERGYVLPNPQTLPELLKSGFQDETHILLSATSTLISGPLFAAIIILAFESGRKGLRDLWQRSIHWRVGGRWYALILAIIFIIYLPPVVVGLLNGPAPSANQALTSLVWFVPVFLFTFVASGLEEPGWRGYALPNLQTRHSAKKASLILGIIWGIWHWPVFIPVYTSLNTSGSPPMEAFVATLVQLVTYTFGAMVGEAFIYTWLYNRTRSVFLCILFHVFHNMAGTYVEMLVPSSGSYVPMLGGIMQWVIAIYLMRNYWVETIPETSAGGKV